MTRPWLIPTPEAQPLLDAVAAAIPVIETERLILRAPRLTDWPVLEPIWTTDRAKFVGGPFDDEAAWSDFCQGVALWVLRGLGGWTVTQKGDGTVLGLVGLFFEYGDDELELGWLLTEAAEGQGFAFEAARAVHAFAFRDLGLPALVSYVASGNDPSIRLAEKLGAVTDPAQTFTDGDGDRTMIFRHRAPDAGSDQGPPKFRLNSDTESGALR